MGIRQRRAPWYRSSHLATAQLAALILGVTATLTACGDGDGSSDTVDSAGTEVTATRTPDETGTPETEPATPSEPAADTYEPAGTSTGTEDESSVDDSADDSAEEGSDGTTGSVSSSDVPHHQWTGTASVTIDFADPGCAGASQSYSLPATLITDDPVGAESNAFHLSWASDSQTAPGAFGITSAQSGADVTDGEPVETGYWSLSDDGGGDISGRLTGTAGSQAIAFNLLFAPKPMTRAETTRRSPTRWGWTPRCRAP